MDVEKRKLEGTVEILKAIADPMRIRLLYELKKGESYVSSLVETVGEQFVGVSRHLRVLNIAGLVRRRKVGNKVFYSVNHNEIFEIIACAKKLLSDRMEESKHLV